ncbi:MAG: FKBP-type peptidyl-prolyl cis-trans isomerase [Gemmatimonadota bacterium]
MFAQHLRVGLLAACCLSACATEEPTVSYTGPIESAPFVATLQVNLAASTKLPSGMYIRDITVGAGPEVQLGQTLAMRYTGSLITGAEFDGTGNKPPYSFQLGAGRVIAGWDQGVVGMRVGGVRQLIIPPALGYGPSGIGPIPGNAILVFTVEVVSAQ